MSSTPILSIRDHSRDVLGLQYVYAVVSRRAGGVSVGINLNPNKACNWQCLYCQVDGLIRGGASVIDVERLRKELGTLLGEIVEGNFLATHVSDPKMRVLQDIAISGDGEPTTSPQFVEVVQLIQDVLDQKKLTGKIRLTVISNGSMNHRPEVQKGLQMLAQAGGEVWMKVDSLIPETIERINGARCTPEQILQRAKASCEVCPTWIQTCLFLEDGQAPAEIEIEAFEHFLTHLRLEKIHIEGMWLYSVARPPRQPGSQGLSAIPPTGLERLAKRFSAFGFPIRVV